MTSLFSQLLGYVDRFGVPLGRLDPEELDRLMRRRP